MKKTLPFFILCFSWLFAHAQIDSIDKTLNEYAESLDEDSIVETIQSPVFSQPAARHISADSIRQLRNEEAFYYMQYADSFFRNKKIQPVKAIKKQTAENQEESETHGMLDNPGVRTLYWLLALAAVGWLVWRMLLGKGSLFTSNKKLTTEIAETHEEKEEITSSKLIEKAISQGNFRLATRQLYLQTLQMLGDKELIMLAPQKTNYQYLQELNTTADRPAFSRLVLHYEYAWYGEFKLSAAQFEIIHNEFKNYQNTIAAI